MFTTPLSDGVSVRVTVLSALTREVCDLTFVDYKTKTPFLNLDFANVTTTELTGESVFAYGGKGHPKRVAFSGEKGGTLF